MVWCLIKPQGQLYILYRLDSDFICYQMGRASLMHRSRTTGIYEYIHDPSEQNLVSQGSSSTRLRGH
jgi:hypothetical protein